MGRSSLPATFWTLVALALSAYAGLESEKQAATLLALFSLPDFLAIPLAQQGEARIVHTLTGIIGGFLTFFALGYLLPAILDALRLGVVSASLSRAYNNKRYQNPANNPLNDKWVLYPLFSRLWRDFAETLHPQTSEDGSRVTYRTTSPAELYFNHQVLVDTPMRVEFFRHLPGMLTGAGIVSTFAGILLGLTEFNPMVGPDEVTGQLKNLFLGVSTAFVASFFAIFTAIVVTVVEKLLLQWRYAQVTLLQGRVDDLFRGGVEPEYLAELAKGKGVGLVMERLDTLLQYLTQRQPEPQPGSDLPAAMERVLTEINASNNQRMEQLVTPPQVMERLLTEIHSGNSQHQNQLSAWPGLMERMLSEINDGNNQRMERLTQTLQDNLVNPLQGISQSVSAILALYESQRAEGDRGMTRRLDQALEKSSAISDGIHKVRDELVQQGEKNAALSERSTTLMVNEITKALREMTDKARESAQERDAFLLARISASHGELAERVKENLESGIAAGLEAPVQSILDKVENLRDDQESLHRSLTDAILEAFAHHLRESVNLLVNQMEGLANRLADERKSMESAFDRLSANILEAAREGGEKLATQLEMALSTAETRQDGMLDVLAKLSGDMRGDINLLAGQIQQAGQEVTSKLSEHTLELAAQADEATQRMLQGAVAGSSQELRETLRALAEEQFRKDRQRDETLLQRMDFASAQIARQLRDALQETEQERQQREQEAEARHEARSHALQEAAATRDAERMARETALEQGRITREEAMEQERRSREQAMEQGLQQTVATMESQLADRIREFLMAEIKRSSDALDSRLGVAETSHRAFTREMTDALMVAMASKVENTFGGLANGLTDLRKTFDSDRHSIEQALQTWAEDLNRTARDGSDALAQQIRQVMNEAENRHNGVLQVLSEFSENLGSRMGRIHDGVLQKGAETLSRLERVEGTIQQSSEESVRQMTTMAREIQEQTQESADSLTRHVDDVVTNTSREQAIFIEALSERLDTLRKRLNINK